jgi:hypothetical protein
MNTYLIVWREKFSMKRDGEGNLYQTDFFEQPFKGKYPSHAKQKWSRLWNLKESDCMKFEIKLIDEKES